jgi:tryptophanyl-tRNA synthetase
MLDDPKVIRKKIMRATTDSNPAVDFDNAGPGVLNLLSIHQAFTGWTDDQVKQHFAGMRYGDLKKTVAEAVVAGLEPVQQRYREIVGEPGYLHGVLREAADRVRPFAADTVRLVKDRMGIYTD